MKYYTTVVLGVLLLAVLASAMNEELDKVIRERVSGLRQHHDSDSDWDIQEADSGTETRASGSTTHHSKPVSRVLGIAKQKVLAQTVGPSHNDPDEWFVAAMLSRGYTQDADGIWWEDVPGKGRQAVHGQGVSELGVDAEEWFRKEMSERGYTQDSNGFWQAQVSEAGAPTSTLGPEEWLFMAMMLRSDCTQDPDSVWCDEDPGQGRHVLGLARAGVEAGRQLILVGLGLGDAATAAGLDFGLKVLNAGNGIIDAAIGVGRQGADAAFGVGHGALDVADGAADAGLKLGHVVVDTGAKAANLAISGAEVVANAMGLGNVGRRVGGAARKVVKGGQGVVNKVIDVSGVGMDAGVTLGGVAIGTAQVAAHLGMDAAKEAAGLGFDAGRLGVNTAKQAAALGFLAGSSATNAAADSALDAMDVLDS